MKAASLNCRAIVTRLRTDYPADHQFHLRFDRCAITVATNNAELADNLKGYFSPFVIATAKSDILVSVHEAAAPDFPVTYTLKQPDPGKTKIKEAYADIECGRIVQKRLTGMIFVFGPKLHAAIGPCLANLNQVVNFINNRYIEWLLCRGCLLGHAAGVSYKGQGLALAGFAGAGKSTLALEIMRDGATFISNDRLMIAEDNHSLIMYGLAKLPRINPGTALNNPHLTQLISTEDRSYFETLSAEALWEVEQKYDASIDECFGPDRFVLSAPMRALVILNWQRSSAPLCAQTVDINSRRDLLPAVMKSVGLFFGTEVDCHMPEPSVANYVERLKRCHVVEFSGGINFEAAAKICLDICREFRSIELQR